MEYVRTRHTRKTEFFLSKHLNALVLLVFCFSSPYSMRKMSCTFWLYIWSFALLIVTISEAGPSRVEPRANYTGAGRSTHGSEPPAANSTSARTSQRHVSSKIPGQPEQTSANSTISAQLRQPQVNSEVSAESGRPPANSTTSAQRGKPPVNSTTSARPGPPLRNSSNSTTPPGASRIPVERGRSLVQGKALGFVIRSQQVRGDFQRHYVFKILNRQTAETLGYREGDEILLLNCDSLVGAVHISVVRRFRRVQNEIFMGYRRATSARGQGFTYGVVQAELMDSGGANQQWIVQMKRGQTAGDVAIIRWGYADVSSIFLYSMGRPGLAIIGDGNSIHLGHPTGTQPDLMDLLHYVVIGGIPFPSIFAVSIRHSLSNLLLKVAEQSTLTSGVYGDPSHMPLEFIFGRIPTLESRIVMFSLLAFEDIYIATVNTGMQFGLAHSTDDVSGWFEMHQPSTVRRRQAPNERARGIPRGLQCPGK